MKNLVDLHLHLDGSVPVETIDLLMGLYPENVPERLKILQDMEKKERLARLAEELQVSAGCTSLNEYLAKFDLPCALLQDSLSLQLATLGLLRDLERDGVKYVEIRFAPQLHSQKVNGEKERFQYEAEFLEAMIQTSKKVRGIAVNFILCCMRNLPERTTLGYDPNMNTLRLAEKFYGQGVCAIDLAGAEARDATSSFELLFETAKEMKLPFTIHAGEAGKKTWRVDSLEHAIRFGAKRLGHGIALEQVPALRRFCKENGIGIEVCPISNLQTKAVCGGIQYHPLMKFLEEGLLVSVNTDNRTVSNTSLRKEFALLSEIGVGEAEKKILMQNAIEMAFADEDTKEWLRTFVR